MTRTVALGDVSQDDEAGTAQATLDWTWSLGAEQVPWQFTTTAALSLDDEDEWQVAWTPALLAPELAEGETVSMTRQVAPRAQVLGANDEVLVEDRPVVRIGLDKSRVEEAGQDAAARALAAALGLDADALAAQVAAAGPKAFVEALVVREGDAAYDLTAIGALTGVNLVKDTLPLAPSRRFARPILGTVGSATAEIIEDSGGTVVAGDLVGLSGLQQRYDSQLRGTPGYTVVATAADGVVQRQLALIAPVAGTPLSTTIDAALQNIAEDLLADVVPASAIVAIRPSTGEVLAAASGAGGEGYSTATLGQYAPGSTFKVASTLALLRAGATPDETVSCPPTLTVEGRQFSNVPGYPTQFTGDVTLRTAFAHSCNTAFLGQAGTIAQSALVTAAGSLGLDSSADLGFSSFLGAVPDDADGTDHAASLIGQGRVLASPLGMATVAASVAAGHTVTPVLVRAAAVPAPATTTEPATPSPTTTPATPLTSDEAETLRELMAAVVTEGGATLLQSVPGDPVIAKTGTAQFGDGTDAHAWIIGAQGDLAVAVFVDVGESGAGTAGPILQAFLTRAQTG